MWIKNDFFTLEKVGTTFEINQGIGNSVCSLGQFYTSIEKFNALMNIPLPMTKKNYAILANNIVSYSKDIEEVTMRDLAIQIHNNTLNKKISTFVEDTSVSCDGTWHHRGFSSNNGVIPAISLENGKVLDVEPMPKFCKGCIIKNDLKQKDRSVYAQWKNLHWELNLISGFFAFFWLIVWVDAINKCGWCLAGGRGC